ncbi:uncharacterized protein LOC141613557 [Silene latifolia]|uniref:uncharacterized protein LOC141613557 n=1 Tax=Silene latifolia TaxID=37657 RepID=UPI003D776EAF
MQNLKTNLHDLHKMLVQAERDMGLNASTSKDMLNINPKSKGKYKKNVNKGKKPTSYKGKEKATENSSSRPKRGVKSDDNCHYCNGIGHWKRNCPKYLEDIKAGCVTPGMRRKEKISKHEEDLQGKLE